MSNKIASKRYAVALFDTVQNEQLDALLADAQSLSGVISESAELDTLLKSPLTKNELKANILMKTVEGLPSQKILGGLVNTLKKNKRLNLFSSVLQEFQDVLFEKRGYQKAKVTTAHAIDEATKKKYTRFTAQPIWFEIKFRISNKQISTWGYDCSNRFKDDRFKYC